MAATNQARIKKSFPSIDAILPVEDRACYGMDTDLFVGPDGETTEDRVYREQDAVLVCRGCVLTSACLAFAIENREKGVWGGTTDEDRRYLRTGRRRPQTTGLGQTKQQAAKALRIKIAKGLLAKGLSFEDIAKEIGVTTGTIYGYFKDDHGQTVTDQDPTGEAQASGDRHADPERETAPVLTLVGGDHES